MKHQKDRRQEKEANTKDLRNDDVSLTVDWGSETKFGARNRIRGPKADSEQHEAQ